MGVELIGSVMGLIAIAACVGGLFLLALLLPVLIGAFLGFMLEWIMPSMTSALLWWLGVNMEMWQLTAAVALGAQVVRWGLRGMFSVEMSTGNAKD